MFILFGHLLLTGTTSAQDGKEKRQRADMSCEKAREVLAEGKPAKKLLRAYDVIVKCPGNGAALAAAWTPPPTDRILLRELAGRSIELADRRIVDATLAVVRNPGASQATRRVAMNVVLAQYDPRIVLSNATWRNPERTILSHVADYWQIPGEQPVSTADRQRIVDAFRAISTSDPDTQIQRVAVRIATDLGRP